MENEYELEELFPLAAKLARRYTNDESSSVTYERAEYLMEAVLYCIRECEKQEVLCASLRLPAKLAYEQGLALVREKTKKAFGEYQRLLETFRAYGNRNCQDTVTKALPEFFRRYDPQLAPQETIITMDYPVLLPLQDVCGIDAVKDYILAIRLEQQFFDAFEPAYIEAALQRYLPAYRSSFENLCSMFLRHVLCRLMLSIGCGNDREKLRKSIEKESIEGLQRRLEALLLELICQKWGENARLAAYLKRDIPDCAAAFLLAARYDTLDQIAGL